MRRIKIKDLPKDMKISREDMQKIAGGGPVIGHLSNPWILGGIVATAIALPLALDDDDDAS